MKITSDVYSFLVLALVSSPILAANAVEIQYGLVEDISTMKKDAKHAGGAVAGGLFGAIAAGPRNHGLKVIASSAAGAAIQGAATSGVLQVYSVNLVDGGHIQVSTEQNDIRRGDCVAVEQGQHANIRRVGAINCEPPHDAPPEHHVTASANCEAAKDELVNATSDESVDIAIRKVRVLCED